MIRTGFLFFFSFFFVFTAHAQKGANVVSKWNNAIDIDGNLNEWSDSLSYYFKDQDLHYEFANDGTYLYVAIRVKNKDRQTQAAVNGFSITINMDGKKKEGPTLIYPLPDRSALRALANQEFDKPKDIRDATLSTIRAYYVRSYPNILDGPISLENNYGIRAAVTIDSDDNLCYESAIRLDQLNLKNNNTFAINVKINGIIRTKHTEMANMGRQGYPYGYGGNNYGYGYGYDDRSRTVIRTREEAGTWQMISLAAHP